MSKQADQIGIYAPYDWDDATYMAGGLWELAINNFGLPVTYLSTGAHESGVHFQWDAAVRNGNKMSFKGWAGGCAQIIWFHINPAKLEQAIALGCTNILVALPHRVSAGDFPAMGRFDRVLCPTKTLYESLNAKMTHKHLQYVPWDSHLPIMEKEGSRSAGRTRVLVPMDSPTARVCGPMIFYTLRVLLDGNPDSHVTVLYGKNWPRHSLLALHELLDCHEDRVTAIKKPTHCQRVEEYRRTDWVFCPNVLDNSGLAAMEALACGAPVVTFNAPPFNEFLRPFHNACLAGCSTTVNSLGVPQIQPNARELLDTLYDAVSNRAVLHTLRQRAWPDMEERRRNFQIYWKRCWSEIAA